jgi:hypothetical protein
MQITKWLRRLSTICFLLVWIPFAVLMFKGPFSMMSSGSQSTAENFLWDTGIWIGLIVTFAIGAAFFLIASLIVGSISNQRIINQGQSAEAKILALTDTGTRINNNPLVNFTLEVYSQTQPPFRAEASQTVSVIHLPSYQPGKIVNVKYLPGGNEVIIVGLKAT